MANPESPICNSPPPHAPAGSVLRRVILAIAIVLPLLAGLVIYLLRGNVDILSLNRSESDIQSIITHLQLYKVQNGTLPSTEQGLAALVEPPSGEPQPKKWRKLMMEIPLDPWGTPYQFRNPGTHSKAGYDVFSAGKDRKIGTADDIVNW